MSADSATTTTSTPSAEVPRFPMPRATGSPFDPPPALRALRADAPITRVRLWDGSTPWLISRYDDQRALLSDPRISADSGLPNYPHTTPGQMTVRKESRTFINVDDPEHARLRRMVTAPVLHQAGRSAPARRPEDRGRPDR
ncbi:hypothetical protein GCM10023191_024700 [Actinoallomurus oryzae]|jgi:cytochrome P450|uniref:Cytochrome P450 n=1 Tax=Actinoallomurus oryzae TaxID=502180 RepID=A0ABP8PTS2_9ACTN